MKFDPQSTLTGTRHHRRSIRLPNYDYTQPGGYFVTIVTYQRAMSFGEIVNGEMRLNDFGRIADGYWRAIPDHFPNVELGAYVVMPNHVHGILVINDDVDADASTSIRSTIYRAPTEQFQKTVSGSIPTIVRSFKSAVTRHIANTMPGGSGKGIITNT
jgi:REP element-mobilizing transposase RayT